MGGLSAQKYPGLLPLWPILGRVVFAKANDFYG
jgi:hypothetical protein